MTESPGKVLIRKIRVQKEDSVFVYAIMESHEGVISYSTLEHPPGALHRDLELTIPWSLREEAEKILDDLGGLIYAI